MRTNVKVIALAYAIVAFSPYALADWPANVKPFARATMSPKSGSEVTGTVDFAKGPDGLHVRANLAHVPPGNHGFHIHAKGDCSAADASSAGDHYNPTGEKHGDPKLAGHHEGDLGNIAADNNGNAALETVISNPESGKFKGWGDIVGKGLILHASQDDLKSQPAGNSGKRIACGVIRSAPPMGE